VYAPLAALGLSARIAEQLFGRRVSVEDGDGEGERVGEDE
jgi:hypothetical protein